MSSVNLEAQKRAEIIYHYRYSLRKLWRFSKYAVKSSKELSKRLGGSAFSYWLDMMWSNIRYGAIHCADYVEFEFYRKSGREKNTFFTLRRFYKLIEQFDKDTFFHMIDKSLMYEKYKDFIKRDWMLIDDLTSEADISAFIERHTSVLVKSISADSGKGIFTIRTRDNDLIKKLIEDKKFHSFLMEEICVNCDELKEINSASLNTLRLVTIVNAQNECEIISANMRIGTGDAVVDNFASGGVGYLVDIETGIICAPGKSQNGKQYIYHPGSNKQVVGMKIPRYEEACKMAKDIIERDKKVIFAGLDLAILPDRIELIEVNFPAAHEMVQVVDQVGKYPIIKRIHGVRL